MKRLFPLLCFFVIAGGATLHSAPAAAQPATVSCSTAIDGYFTSSDWLNIVGARITARGSYGFSSFTMAAGYDMAAHPLHTSGAAPRSVFTAPKGSSHFTGPFSEVFPGRGNNDIDDWEFWVSRSGVVWLRSITWGGTWSQLQGVSCYRGPQNQTVVTGYYHMGGTYWGTDFWTFVLAGDTLI